MAKERYMKQIIGYTALCVVVACGLASCEHVSETPEVNMGYKTNFRLPDPEFLTDEDRAFIEAQEAEYERNAK